MNWPSRETSPKQSGKSSVSQLVNWSIGGAFWGERETKTAHQSTAIAHVTDVDAIAHHHHDQGATGKGKNTVENNANGPMSRVRTSKHGEAPLPPGRMQAARQVTGVLFAFLVRPTGGDGEVLRHPMLLQMPQPFLLALVEALFQHAGHTAAAGTRGGAGGGAGGGVLFGVLCGEGVEDVLAEGRLEVLRH